MKKERAPQGLIARVGDCCMWFGRYVERAESTARELQATLSLALDGELTPRQCWLPLVVVAGEQAAFRERNGDAALDDGDLVQSWLVWDESCAVSLLRSVGAARENARSIRDVLSAECWEAINELYLWLGSDRARADWIDDRDGFYDHVRGATQLCLGLLRSTMLHDTTLDFMWLGMLVERVGQTARLLDVHHHAFAAPGADAQPHQVIETTVWMALLRALSGVEPFMRAHSGRVTGEAVAGFLVGEARFPRSIAYCVHSAYQRLCAIRPPSDHDVPGGEALERLRALDAWVATSPWLAGEPLHDKLTHVVDETAAICDTISRELFGTGRVVSMSQVES
ncbi:MAG TPA: alpha-E domain-containing protein [Kofleriaceae bacterium]|nr:alpha-E domain-containing protein [Kofleriaceae bacterium]